LSKKKKILIYSGILLCPQYEITLGLLNVAYINGLSNNIHMYICNIYNNFNNNNKNVINVKKQNKHINIVKMKMSENSIIKTKLCSLCLKLCNYAVIAATPS